MKLLPLLLLLGCSTTSMTETERAAYLIKQEQKAYDRQAARDTERDQIRALIMACEYQGRILIYDGPQSSRTSSSLRKYESYIHPHAKLWDYACMSRNEFERWMGGGY